MSQHHDRFAKALLRARDEARRGVAMTPELVRQEIDAQALLMAAAFCGVEHLPSSRIAVVVQAIGEVFDRELKLHAERN